MKLSPGKKTLANWLFQKRVRRLGISLGARQAIRLFGPIGLWAHCLSQTKSLAEAIAKWSRVAPLPKRLRNWDWEDLPD